MSDVVTRIERYIENHPDSTIMGVLANVRGAHPAKYHSVVEALLEGDDAEPVDGSLTDEAEEEPVHEHTSTVSDDTDHVNGPYADLEWQPANDVFPETGVEYDHWMPVDGKLPIAPYASTENRRSWSDPGNWTDFDSAAEWREMHPQLTGLAFILQSPHGEYNGEPDPMLFVDYDDVVDEETGEPHPEAVALMNRLGMTYTDLSTSGSGVHQVFRGRLPERIRTIQFELPNGAGEVEIYDRKRVMVATGKHIPGTPEDIEPVDGDALQELIDEHTTDSRSSSTTREDWEPEFDRDELADLDSSSNITAIFDAIRQVQPRDIRLRSKKTEKRPDGTLSFDPTWSNSSSGKRLGWSPDIGWIYRKGDRGLDALQVVALEEGIIRSVTDYPQGEDFWRAVDELRNRGARIPEYEPPEDSSTGAGATQYDIETCTPPVRDADAFDREQRWDELQDERFDAVLEDDKLHLFGDEAGAGKTTNAALGALKRDRSHTIYFQQHKKAREFITDDAIRNFEIDRFDDGEYYHLRGAEQKRKGHCMDADHADEDCPEHGDTHDCPSMCPVYDLDKEHPTREAYEALVPEVGPNKAHQILELNNKNEHPWHNGECAWQAQYSDLESEPFVAGVHPYMTQKSARDTGVNIIDETPGLDAFKRTFSVTDLTRIANTLDSIADHRDESKNYRELAQFARDAVDVLTNVDGADTLEELEPPMLEWEEFYQSVGQEGDKYVRRVLPGETLAEIKINFGETILERMHDDRWEGTPLSIDPLLATAAQAGLDEDPVMKAIAVPPLLEHCPWCRSDIKFDNGAHCCASDDCDWHEHEHTITRRDGEQARATTWVQCDRAGAPTGLAYRELPLPSTLPDPESTVVLDATANPEKVATLFDIDRDDVVVSGDAPLEIPGLEVTQVLDGQYHAGTIDQAVDEERKLADRIQRTIDTVGAVHEKPLFICKSSLIAEFDFPEHAEVLHYHATRGLNRNDCDAVVCIGAPHPDIGDLERDAELLAMGQDDFDVGGVEHSTRDGAECPPVYRKLHYEDENGRGRSVPTKHYTGLVGSLFREGRESELVQAIHRVRPLLADPDDPKHAYLLTNVPTEIPVDEVAAFEELADPLEALLPVPEGAIDLLRHVDRVLEGNGPNGFRPESLVDERDDGSIAMNKRAFHRLAQLQGMDITYATISRYVNALEDVGLLEGERYEQHTGVAYASDPATFTAALQVLSNSAGLKVAAARRFRSILEESGRTADWLAWAREVFDLEFSPPGRGAPPDAGG
ncbi:hypothetical protein [Natrialba chahannaoensis]|uniref:hypothetical protein n=1 Tax=Natrialba chahannaoensis TaxID=68911 RepID=UPI0012682C23|nr:hypothetical protein [Natrialba chahannaoensis]